MRAKVLLFLSLSVVSAFGAEATDSVQLPEVEVSVSRIARPAARQQLQSSVLDTHLINEAQVSSPKDISSLAPNTYMPDYGSAMTSSIYIRGMGSRINQPVMAMVVDGVPLMDKNLYDHVLQDTKRIEFLRGAQGSLYGRNAPAGVLEIRTLRPLDLSQYTVRASVGYSTANTINSQASYYDRRDSYGWGISARYGQTDGFYTNAHTGQLIDHGRYAGGRLVFDAQPNEHWRLAATVYADWLRQGAFPYADANTGVIAYNRPGSYERMVLMPSLTATFTHSGYQLLLATSYQYLHDDMLMDQDYTVDDIFTLRQHQRQHNVTLDALLRGPKPCEWYEWSVGISAFAKQNPMQADVIFMRQGIDDLILHNANAGMQQAFPDDSLVISNTTLPILSHFDMFGAGASAYHESHFRFDHFHINAALRFDYEYARMAYLSTADVDYLCTVMMSELETVHTRIEGTQHQHFTQFSPRLAVSYEDTWGTVYASAAKGYKAGGYNPQIFSTITQNQVMTDIASDMGMHLSITDPRFSDVAITSYRPERDWTFELGAHLTPVMGLQLDLAAFHTRCYDQQVTVFPTGKTTGRMMANAAESRIWGAETALHYRWSEGRWSGLANISYGFTDARFVSFNDGMGDYSGNVIPYCPRHTLHGMLSAAYSPDRKWLRSVSLTLRGDGVGPIYWNEQNDRRQEFYGLMAATLQLNWKYISLQLWSRNLTNTRYNVFYFRSMGNDFLQRARPRELGATLKMNI